MHIVLLGFFALLAAVLISAPVLIGAVILIRRTNWTRLGQKLAFIVIGTFLAFPVVLPAGGAVIPFPNWLALGMVFWKAPDELLGIPLWYAKGWQIHLPGFFGMALLMTGIAAMAFFPSPHTPEKITEPFQS